MDQEIKNKVVLITGAAGGIGYAISENILEQGAKLVIVVDTKSNLGIEAVKTLNSKYGENKAVFVQADVTTDLNDVFNLIVDKYKSIDILVNNAGIADETDTQKIFDINIISLIQWTKKFLGIMRKDKGGNGGTILNIASIYGHFINPFLSVYKATKFGVMGFTKTVGHVKNYEVTGVKVVALCPGYTFTEIMNNAKADEDLLFLTEADEHEDKQNPTHVSEAAIKVITSVLTGTAWSIIGAKPIVEV